MILRLAGLLLMAPVLIAGSCLGLDLKKEYPDRSHFALDANRAGNAGTPAPGTALAIRMFRAARGFEAQEFVYLMADSNYESDYYNRFFTTPASQATEVTSRWLRGAGLFENVIDDASRAEPSHLLEGIVQALYADLRETESPKVTIALRFVLLDEATHPARIVLNKEYREEVAVSEVKAEAFVAGWNTGLERILRALETDLAALR